MEFVIEIMSTFLAIKCKLEDNMINRNLPSFTVFYNMVFNRSEAMLRGQEYRIIGCT